MIIRGVSKCECHTGMGGYRISEKGGGVPVTVKYYNAGHSHARAQRLFPLYEVGGSPKTGEGAGGPGPQPPPPPPVSALHAQP